MNLRRRRFTLLRAVGATRGQVRRAILAGLAVCGVADGALGWLPGAGLGAVGVRALAARQMLPAGSAAWLSPWLSATSCRGPISRRHPAGGTGPAGGPCRGRGDAGQFGRH